MFKHLFILTCAVIFFAGASVAQHGMKDKSGSGKVTVVIHHEVKEYTAWKKVFDADQVNRKAVGFKVTGVYTDAANPNKVTVIGRFASAEAADAFIANPKLKDAMEKGGVMGAPQVMILRMMSEK